MAQDSRESSDSKQGLLDRRSMLKLTGATAAAGVGVTSLGAASAATTVDLGNHGLSEDDLIDDYLETHFTSGTTVIIPEGEYRWQGSGLTGTYSDANLIGDGDVVFRFPDGHSHTPSILAEGDVVIANVTIRGTAGRGRHRIRVDARASDASVLVHNVNQPDGGVDRGIGIGFYVGSQHAGEATFRDCVVQGFPNNGIYASAPGGSGGGTVHVEGGIYKNNNISNVRVGSSGSSVRDVVSVQDDAAPRYESGARNQRGIWIRTGGTDVVVENVDADHSYGGANSPLLITARNGGGSGTVRDMRVRTGTNRPAILQTTGDWSGSNVHVSGDGSYSMPGWVQNVSRGSEATAPDTEPRAVADLGDGGSGNPNWGRNTGRFEDATELAIVANDGVPGLGYTFTSDGPIRKVTDADSRSAESNDSVVSNGDGTYTATGLTGNGYGDTFLLAGSVTDFEISASADAYRLIRNNEEISREELLDPGNGNSGDDDSDSGGEDGAGSEPPGSRFEVVAVQNGPKFTYEFTVEGTVEKLGDAGDRSAEINDVVVDNDDGSVTVTGVTGNGYGDSYRVDGTVTEFLADTDLANVRLHYEDASVTALTLTHPNVITFDAGEAGETAEYTLEIDGSLEHVGGEGPDDQRTDGSVVRVTGALDDGTHRYRYAGSLHSLDLSGTTTVTIDDNET